MATINEVARARRVVFRDLLRVLKSVDTSVETLQRFGKRILGRKRNVPSDQDLEKWLELSRQVAATVDDLARAGTNAVNAYGVVN